MHRVLLVEDDPVIAEAIRNHLSMWDYDVSLVSDFRNIIKQFSRVEPHVVLLDITLPYRNGYYWCTEIRKVSKVPIMFISSASEDMNIVMAMNMGADDFIIKPFNLSVLSAKLSALMRRTYSFGQQTNIIEYRGVVLNLNSTELSYQGQTIELTKNDFKIMQILLENAEKVVSREEIMISMWNSDRFIDDNTLTVNITRLRKKISDIGLEDFIITKKNMGYMVGGV